MATVRGVIEEVEEWVPPEEEGGDSDRPHPGEGDYRGWLEERAACAASSAYFIDRFGVIDYPRAPVVVNLGGGVEVTAAGADGAAAGGGLGGTLPFRLWPSQVPVMASLELERLVLILKARQLGISWLVCGYVLWVALFHPNQNIFLYSKGQAESSEMLRRIRALLDRLPRALRRLLPGVTKGQDNTRAMGFANGSVIRSMPSTEKAGVSHTASVVVMDEAAHMARGAKLYEMVKPIMEAGGQLVVLSTANGAGDWFHQLWTAAQKGASGFFRIFLPWWSRPGRDESWYRRVLRDALDPEQVKENYPATAEEAFRSTGRNRFRAAWLDRQGANLRSPLPAMLRPRALRSVEGLEIWSPPAAGRRYVVTADVAEGLEHGDYNGAHVFDADTWEQAAQVHHKEEPADFAADLAILADWYNMAWAWPERNNHGHAVLTAWRLGVDRGDGRGPQPFTRVGRGPDGRDGWETNTRTKPEGVDSVAEVLKEGAVTLRSETLVGELRNYKRLRAGRLGAPPGMFDDLVMALVIATWVLRQGRETFTGGPQTTGVERRHAPDVLGREASSRVILGGRRAGRTAGVGEPIRTSRHTRRR